MDISQLTESQFVDLFNSPTDTSGAASGSTPKFGMSEQSVDLFNPSLTETTTLTPSTTDTTTLAPSTTETTTQKPLDEVDLLGGSGKEEGKTGPGRPPKYDFSDLSGYFEDRTKKGLFAPVKITDDKGEEIDFIPKTPEEFDEVIQMQIDHKLGEAIQDVDKQWYGSKSPAWQLVAKYAENVTHPSELLPMIQGVQTIESIAKVDESQVEGAEQLVRMQLLKTGNPQELVDAQVEALKTTNKLVETAQKIKPAMLQQEQQQMARLQQDQQRQIDDYRNMVVDIRDNAIKAIEQPLGKEKLKQDEKAAIYELIAVPDEATRGYGIFNKIDELFDKKDFDKLRKIALLLTNEESFTKYVTAGVQEKVAEGLQKKLRIASENRGTSATDTATGNTSKPVIRQPYTSNTKPRFGRGN